MRTLLCSVVSLSLLAACPKPPPPPPVFTPPTDSVELSIRDRDWDTTAPPEGWCGETCIQMAGLYYGVWIPQRVANEKGKPKTPDLWEHDVPVAMSALGVRFQTAPKEAGAAALLDWTVKALREGKPVILGVKLLPTKHPDWEVDHLVLAVGFSPEGLLLNTNLEGQQRVPWLGLLTKEGSRGFSLVNDKGTAWGFAVEGVTGARAGVRADVIYDLPEAVTLRFESVDGGVLEDVTVPRDELYSFETEAR